MKIGSFVPNADYLIENIKVFRPCQVLLFHLKSGAANKLDALTDYTPLLNVVLQNSKTGASDTIVPFIQLGKLGEIASFNEGVILGTETGILIPVMLNPAGNISLDNDKYLDVQLSGLQDFANVDIYAFETGKNSDFVTKYMKVTAPMGVARHKTSVGQADLVSFPTKGFESIQLTYKGGIVTNMTKTELQYYAAKNNDLTAMQMGSNDSPFVPGTINDTLDTALCFIFGCYATQFIVNLIDVESIEIIRDVENGQAFEYILGDLVKNV